MKKIKLYIHGGFGRAGTTFLQKKIFNNFDKIFSFGKDYSVENEDFFKLQEKCFKPEYIEIRNDYPSNNFYFIENFSKKFQIFLIMKIMKSFFFR